MKQEILRISDYLDDIRSIVGRRASASSGCGGVFALDTACAFSELVSVLCFYAKSGARVIFGGRAFEQIYLSFLECCGIIDKGTGLLEANSKDGVVFVEDGITAFGVANAIAFWGRKQKKYVVFLVDESVMLEDGVWEEVIFSSKHHLENLLVFIAYTGERIGLRFMPIADKWRSFGWGFFEINGNSLEHLLGAVRDAGKYKGVPVAVLSYLSV